MRVPSRWLSWLLLPGLFFAFGSSAEDAWPELGACREVQDDTKRADCYDRAYDARAGGAAAADITPQQRFGYGDVREREERAAEQRGERLQELVATVTDVQRRADGKHVVTLDNGQVWGERSLDAAFRVRAGDRVRIQAAAMGSYLMITPERRSTRVTRLQ